MAREYQRGQNSSPYSNTRVGMHDVTQHPVSPTRASSWHFGKTAVHATAQMTQHPNDQFAPATCAAFAADINPKSVSTNFNINPSRFRVPPAEIRSQKSRPNEFSLSLRLLSIPLGQFFQVAKDASTEMGTSPRSICLAQLDGFGHVPPSTSLSSSIVTFIPQKHSSHCIPSKGNYQSAILHP